MHLFGSERYFSQITYCISNLKNIVHLKIVFFTLALTELCLKIT